MRQGLAEEGRTSTALPAEIGFLARHGYAPDLLRDAAILARLAGVTPDVFLLKNGLVEEPAFYRALALELALPFLPAPRLSLRAEYPGSILTGLAPLAKHGFVIAPEGATLAELLKRHPQGLLQRLPLAVTAPSLLAKGVFAVRSRTIAERASHDLPDRRPDLSSRDGARFAQIAAASLLSGAFSFCASLQPELTLAVAAAGLSPLFFGLVVLRLAASFLDHPVEPVSEPPRIEDAALPVYTIIIALYRERRVVSRLIAALARLDYPVLCIKRTKLVES
jgi:hypothetical protein